jgi:hypothetical protein
MPPIERIYLFNLAAFAGAAVTGGFSSCEPALNYSEGAANAGIYGKGLCRAIFCTGPTFHTAVFINNYYFAVFCTKNPMGAYFGAFSAANAFIRI